MAADAPKRDTNGEQPRPRRATTIAARSGIMNPVNLEDLASRPAVSRLLRNDARVMDAAVMQIAEGGWEGLSIKAVAQRAGLSEQAVKDRHQDRNGLALAAWTNEIAPALIDLFEALHDSFVRDGFPVERAARAAPWQPLAYPTPIVRAGFELLVVAQYLPDLHAAVDASLAARLRALCGDLSTPSQRQRATASAFLFLRALGLGLLSPILTFDDDDLVVADRDTLAVFAAPGEGAPLPDLFLPPFLSERFDDDPRIDALLRTTLDQVARNGFHDTSLVSITDTVGVPKAFALTRYRSKLGLFLEASRVQRIASLEANVALQRRLQEKSDAITITAAFTRAALRRGLELPRALNLEQTRLASREAQLRESLRDRLERETLKQLTHTPLHEARHATLTSMTLAEGLALLPTLLPDAWALPWDVAWRPLMTPSR
jgi:AcrR family transcriptional regulator